MLYISGITVVLAPVLLLAVFGVTTLFRIPLSERNMARFTEASTVIGLISALFILSIMLVTGERNVSVVLGDWVRTPTEDSAHEHDGEHQHDGEHKADEHQAPGHGADQHKPEEQETQHAASTGADSHEGHFHFKLKFVFDRLSVPFVVMTFVLCGVIAAFASRYLHRDEGFHRFFIVLFLFPAGNDSVICRRDN